MSNVTSVSIPSVVRCQTFSVEASGSATDDQTKLMLAILQFQQEEHVDRLDSIYFGRTDEPETYYADVMYKPHR